MKDFLRHTWYWLCKHILSLLPDSAFFNLQTWVTFKRHKRTFHKLDINNPKRFNEKIHWLKIHPQVSDGDVLADKYRVREFIKNTIGEKYLVPLLGVWDNADDVDFDKLPNKFALKANHGSGWNIICKDKSKLDINKARKKMRYWMKHDQYPVSREWQYKKTPHKIICEQFLEYNILDYKFFCFNGNPRFIQVDVNRFTNHRRAFFTTNWEPALFSISYQKPEIMPERPAQLEEMVYIAKKLSQNKAFIRVDLYVHDNNVFFGEITLHPGGGAEPFIPDEYDYKLGEMLKL